MTELAENNYGPIMNRARYKYLRGALAVLLNGCEAKKVFELMAANCAKNELNQRDEGFVSQVDFKIDSYACTFTWIKFDYGGEVYAKVDKLDKEPGELAITTTLPGWIGVLLGLDSIEEEDICGGEFGKLKSVLAALRKD